MAYESDPKTNWRGVTVCTCMKAPLDELAKISGSAIYVQPIPRFGSYQDGTTASGNIALRGGHIDLNLETMSQAQALTLEALARKVGFYADIRYRKWYSPKLGRWLTASWQKHLHMVLKGDVHLWDLAKAQVYGWRRLPPPTVCRSRPTRTTARAPTCGRRSRST